MEDNVKTETRRASLLAGSNLAHPLPGEEVVISGISGWFPESDNMYQLRDNLYDKVNVISTDNRRWEPTHPEIPHATGKVKNIAKFDAGYFGIHHRQATSMDPQGRLILERAIEAILDAGVNPQELKGTKTGVFIAVAFTEADKFWHFNRAQEEDFATTGACSRSTISQRISYFLQVKGPSFTTEAGCSSSIYALEYAYRSIRNGECDSAIVGGTNLILSAINSLKFERAGILSKDGICKSFDKNANGYVRSEAIVAIFLQKSKDSRRIYTKIVHAKTNCDGFKEEGITHPSSIGQRLLLEELYEECEVDPSTIDYLEAHATGTTVGDVVEVTALDSVFCKNRKTPLLIGSVKSNIGHTEPVSGLCSIAKIIIGIENGFLPPNLHYNETKQELSALIEGRMKVATEKILWPFNSGLAGVNNFGFGGTNAHVLLRANSKTKINSGIPNDNLPRLICLNGRNEESVKSFLDDLKNRPLDAEYVALLHKLFKNNIAGFKFRGYSILSKEGEIFSSTKKFDEIDRPVYFVFGNPAGSHWLELGRKLLVIPQFQTTIHTAHEMLLQKNINLLNIIYDKNHEISGKLLVLGCLIVQIGLVDVFKALEIKPDQVVGISLGEFPAAYYDGVLTMEETVISVYSVLYIQMIKSEFLKRIIQKIFKQRSTKPSKWMTGDSLNLNDNSKEVLSEYISNIFSKTFDLDNTNFSIERHSVIFEMTDGKISKYLSKKIPKYQIEIVELFKQKDTTNDYFVLFLKKLGSLFELGLHPKLSILYPEVSFPVSRGTPMISPLVKWEHEKDWFMVSFNEWECAKNWERFVYPNINSKKWEYLKGHVVDGRIIFPAVGYLDLVWETLAIFHQTLKNTMNVIFENVSFNRLTILPKDGSPLELLIMIQKISGNFEVIENGVPIVTGKVKRLTDPDREMSNLPILAEMTVENELELNAKDIYKELRLRGCQYKGLFRSLLSCNNKVTKGMISWQNNFVTFIDSMLQFYVLNEDTRNSFVPIAIQRIVINVNQHDRLLEKVEKQSALPVYFYKDENIVKAGGIEIRRMFKTSLHKKKIARTPVLETYKFLPYEANLSTFESVTANMQLILENNYGIKIKVLELLDQFAKDDSQVLSPLIQLALGNLPLIQAEILILSDKSLKVENVTVENKNLESENNCGLIIATEIFKRRDILKNVYNALKDGGYILSRENLEFDHSMMEIPKFTKFSVYVTDKEKLILLRKNSLLEVKLSNKLIVNISDVPESSFSWLQKVQDGIKSNKEVIIYSERQPLSGILGLANCLRKEPDGEKVKCFFIIDDDVPPFDIENDFYSKQLEKDFAINVFKCGKWGTYRHFLMNDTKLVQVEHSFVNSIEKGDLSSLRWIESPLKSDSICDVEKTQIQVYYSSLNFRDIMMATGRLKIDGEVKTRLEEEFSLGFEYVGRDLIGRRIMGMVKSGALATIIKADLLLSWNIPDKWTMVEAATIPLAYYTVVYSFIKIGKLKRGESVLIHSGSGGVGQAAIHIASHYGCEIFTTVGTKEKKKFLLEKFPQIKESHIGNSRDVSFEQMILQETNGRGVDVVLNSLSEEKLLASLRCLASGGRFLEIGRYDIANNHKIPLSTFLDGRSYHGIAIETLFNTDPVTKHELQKLIYEHIENGSIKPIAVNVFREEEVEAAFRLMASGKHIGKVLVKIREEEQETVIKPISKTIFALPRFYCDSKYSYVILGGLGGFGLELATWLIIRGAKNVVLVSRSGIKTGYQAMRMRIWKWYGVKVKISTADVTKEEGCVQVLNEANELGPVHSIFNLAVLLNDAIFENQNVDNFILSFGPKAQATAHLDKLSRIHCPQLRDFVVFSSVVTGRGNSGQTNYGMANSVMERICEKRKNEGLPALAIQWGAIGDVGIVADMQEEDKNDKEIEIGGSLQQRISSCFEVLDVFLRQDEPIVSSMVIAHKRSDTIKTESIVDSVINILGVKDIRQISLYSTLPELGMDSMMAVEIKQILEREFDFIETVKTIRNMTFARLQEMDEERKKNKEQISEQNHPEPILMLLQSFGRQDLANVPIIKMKSLLSSEKSVAKVFLLPGLEGISSEMEKFAAQLNFPTYCLQYQYEESRQEVATMATDLLRVISHHLPEGETFKLVGYSFGCIVALELAGLFEKLGRQGSLLLIDGAPEFLNKMLAQQLNTNSEAEFETGILCRFMSFYMPKTAMDNLMGRVEALENMDERIKLVIENSPQNFSNSEEYLIKAVNGVCKRLRSMMNYKPNFTKLKSVVKLLRPITSTFFKLDNDYGLSKLCEKEVEVKYFEGNHSSILKNRQVEEYLNKELMNF